MNIRTVSGIVVVVGIIAMSGYISLPPSSMKSSGNTPDYMKSDVSPSAGENENMQNPDAVVPLVATDIPEATTTLLITDIKPSAPPILTPAPKPTPTPTPALTPTLVQKPSGYSARQVATHDDETSCWTIINDSVYDLTAFMSLHPGGKARILGICGSDGTSSFEGQHEGDTKPAKMLARYKIGVLTP